MRLALLTLALMACGGASEEPVEPPVDPTDTDTTDTDTTDTDTTDTDTTDTDTTDTETTDTGTGEDIPVVLGTAAPPKGRPAVLTGLSVSCLDAQEALVDAEFFGPLGTVEATPIVAGALLAPSALTVEERSMFHRAEATVAVTDCEATSWRVVALAHGVETCLVAGPGAADWLSTSGADCELR